MASEVRGQDGSSATELILRARVPAAASACLRFAIAVRSPSNEAEEFHARVRGDFGALWVKVHTLVSVNG